MSEKTPTDNNDQNVAALQQMMFDQMKRLSDPDADLDKEIKRGQALTGAGTVIINAAKVQIDAARVAFQQSKPALPGNKAKMISNGK